MTQEDSPKNNQIDDLQKILNMKRKTSSSTKWAMGLTGVWAAVVLILGYMKWPQLVCMPPNEWGDFLAGTFSPLALLWLVAGYRQQGDELFLNTKALLMQQVEMKNQVEEFKKLAIHSGEQAESSAAMVDLSRKESEQKEIESRSLTFPKFRIAHISGHSGVNETYRLYNEGHEVHNIDMQSPSFNDFRHSHVNLFPNGGNCEFYCNGLKDGVERNRFTVRVYFTTVCGRRWMQEYNFRDKHGYLSKTELQEE
jgi:hypothetical protein